MEKKHTHEFFKFSQLKEVLLLLFFGFSISVKANLYSVPVARITLLSLERGHLRTVTNKVNHEVVLTLPTRYFEAYAFECNASYPVEWNYIGDGAPTATADVGRHFEDFYNVNTYTYQSNLLLYNLEELQSGKYVCRGSNPEQTQLQIFYDLFVPGNGSRTFLSTAEKDVFISEMKPIAVLPCPVSDPRAVINLYKGNNMGTFQRIETNHSIIFLPKKGFRLKMHELSDPFGNYMCTTHDNKRRRKINLIPERLKSKYEASSPLKGKIPVKFSYDHEFNRVLCCTGTPFVTKLQWAGCGSVLDCKIKSVCFEEDRCEPRLGSNTLSQAKWVDPGPLPKGCTGWKLRNDPNGDHGIFKCSSPGVSQYQPYLLNRGNIFLDFEKAPPSEAILSLVKTSDEPAYVGSEIEYHCNSTRFYFAYGIRWAFQRGNGDIEFVQDSNVVKDRYFRSAHRRQTTFKVLHKDIKAIICFVPIANSATEWRTVSLPILVRESFNIPLPLNNVLGDRNPEFLSNEIIYSSQPNQYEPYSTLRPKGYFDYQTAEDLLVSNNNKSPEVISNPPKSSQVSEVQPNSLHETQTRDYLYSPPNNKPVTSYKSHPNRSHQKLWDNAASSHLTTAGHQPSGYFNIHTSQFEPLGSSMDFIGSTQSSPTLKPKINYESQTPNLRYKNHHSWPKHSNEYQPSQSSQRVRDGYNNYATSTTRPQGHFDYRAKGHEHTPTNGNIPNVFSSVRTSPAPMVQSVIHFDSQEKEYSLRYPTMDLKTHKNNPIGSSQRAKNDPASKYPIPVSTQSSPSYYFNDKGPIGPYTRDDRFPDSQAVLSSQQNSHGSLYGQSFRGGSHEIIDERRNRMKSTTPSPQYYNYNQTSHYHTDFWERPSSPQPQNNFDDFDKDRQYYNSKEFSPFKNVEVPSSSDGSDANFYYQRYASESREFPFEAVEHSNIGIGPTAHSYSNDNFIRRSDNIYGDSVPLVELG